MLRPRRLYALALCALTVLSAVPAAHAWKPSTHLYLAVTALDDALDGKVTISRVNYETGQHLGTVGEYRVDERTLQALREYPAQFLAGVLGPDAYPDILTGQSAIHPEGHGSRYRNVAYGSDAWLQYLWERGTDQNLPIDERLPVRAFTVGFLTHAAGDTYSHTFVNYFAGGPFTLGTNAAKHFVLESYIGERAPTRGPYTVSIKGTEDFILRTLVRAEADSHLMKLLEGVRQGTDKKSAAKHALIPLSFVPLTFSRLRAALLNKRQGMSKKMADLADEWVAFIDEGLAAWGPLNQAIGEALFYSDGHGKADLARAEELLKEYSDKYLKKMLLAHLGAKLEEYEKLAEDIVPDWVMEAVDWLRAEVKKRKQKIFRWMYRKATRGKEFDDLKRYLNDPATYIEPVLNDKCTPERKLKPGEVKSVCLPHEELDRLLGVTHGDCNKFSPDGFAPAYNTVLMTKLLLLDRVEMERLLRDLGATVGRNATPAMMVSDNAMLGFNQSLDGGNQWAANKSGYRMALVRGLVYDQLFKQQKGEQPYGIEFYLSEKAMQYGMGKDVSPMERTRNGEGQARQYERGRVYWSPVGGVRAVRGAILAAWEAGGGEASPLGLPVSDQLPSAGGDWYQFFEHGAVYWRNGADTALIFQKRTGGSEESGNYADAIRLKAESLGLGAPHQLTPEPVAQAGDAAWWQRFERGYVYWSAGGGVRWLSGSMWEVWMSLAGSLGPPVTDELEAQGGDAHDRYQFFEQGLLYRRANSDLVCVAYVRP